MNRSLPIHILEKYGTAHNFKKAKRKDLNDLKSAFSQVEFCSAFTPVYAELVEIDHLINRAVQKLSVKNWGR